MRAINEIIIHCTATNEGMKVTAADVDRWHKKNGWDGIGYHYLILQDGTIESGRPEEKAGAHTIGHNSKSIGVCYVGGLRCGKAADTRTGLQKVAMIELCKKLLAKFPNAKISGHNQWAAKACPCFNAAEWARENGLPYDNTIRRV